jgi:hypothetical protein
MTGPALEGERAREHEFVLWLAGELEGRDNVASADVVWWGVSGDGGDTGVYEAQLFVELTSGTSLAINIEGTA